MGDDRRVADVRHDDRRVVVIPRTRSPRALPEWPGPGREPSVWYERDGDTTAPSLVDAGCSRFLEMLYRRGGDR